MYKNNSGFSAKIKVSTFVYSWCKMKGSCLKNRYYSYTKRCHSLKNALAEKKHIEKFQILRNGFHSNAKHLTFSLFAKSKSKKRIRTLARFGIAYSNGIEKFKNKKMTDQNNAQLLRRTE